MMDSTLTQGVNTYRAKITLSNGQFVYSDPQTVYYTGGSNYLVYPNPVLQNQAIHIIAAGLDNAVFRLYNVWGQLVLEKTLYNLTEDIPAALAKGVYFYTLLKDGRQDARGRIIIQ
jgi:hypothetical protein